MKGDEIERQTADILNIFLRLVRLNQRCRAAFQIIRKGEPLGFKFLKQYICIHIFFRKRYDT